MTGLRERQKADRSVRILKAASDLFRAQGYDAVRIEDIAAIAEVSTGTCYNYFSTKGDLLLAIVSMEVEEVVEAGRALVESPPPDISKALGGLIRLYYDHSLMYLSRCGGKPWRSRSRRPERRFRGTTRGLTRCWQNRSATFLQS